MKKIFLIIIAFYNFQSNAQSIRKNYLEMTQAEYTDYVNAITALYNSGHIPDIAEHHGEHFSTKIHSVCFPQNGANGEYFLPWHRFFLLDFEEYIHATSSTYKHINIPYWDWTNEPSHTSNSSSSTGLINFNTSPNFFGTSDVLGGSPSFLALSKFTGWTTSTYSLTSCGGVTSAVTTPLNRNYQNSTLDPAGFGRLPMPADITSAMNLTTFFNPSTNCTVNGSLIPNAANFSHRIEAWHNKIHVWFGGGLTMDSGGSPLDPSFFLHHCMIDKLWYNREEATTGISSAFPNGTTSMTHYDGVHDPNIVVPNATVDTRQIQRPLVSGSGRKIDVWYAENKKVVLDGANGTPFIASDVVAPYLYRYTAANTPGTANVNDISGDIFVGDIMRDASGNIVLDTKGGFVVNPLVTCDFRSGGGITFLPGFEASYQSVTSAKIITSPSGFKKGNNSTTSIEQELASDYILYPNPVSNVLHIENGLIKNETVSINIYSIDGKIVYSNKNVNFNTRYSVDVSKLTTGIYFVTVNRNGKLDKFKFTKQ